MLVEGERGQHLVLIVVRAGTLGLRG